MSTQSSTSHLRRGIALAALSAAAVSVFVGSGAVAKPADRHWAGADATSATTRAATGDPQPLRITDLPTGAAPKVMWWEPGLVHRADGTTLAINSGVIVDQLAPIGRGAILGTRDSYGLDWATWLRAAGTTKRLGPMAGQLGRSDRGRVVAWVAPNGAVTIAQRGGAEIWPMPQVEALGTFSVAGVTSEDCKEGRSTDGGCGVVVAAMGPNPATYGSFSHGFSDIMSWKLLTPYDVSKVARLAVGVVSYDHQQRTCSAGLNLGRDQILWRNCDLGAREISPDGTRVAALSRSTDDWQATSIGVIDAKSGRTQWWLRDGRQGCGACVRVVDVAWEDDQHLLAVVYNSTNAFRGQWSIVRWSVDGTAPEYAVAPRAGRAPWLDDPQPVLTLAS